MLCIISRWAETPIYPGSSSAAESAQQRRQFNSCILRDLFRACLAVGNVALDSKHGCIW
ncbi:hypothetical protein CSUI_004328 [Cystoisospora suis]|uniref:Uncharacterized protein n=1 Tax=Cystoisospora suis TaxID=483139 RepID=A0A2C6L1C8_9APIC|nr:hypothetical protein CSUI_004328 [Cystoisospora suis]